MCERGRGRRGSGRGNQMNFGKEAGVNPPIGKNVGQRPNLERNDEIVKLRRQVEILTGLVQRMMPPSDVGHESEDSHSTSENPFGGFQGRRPEFAFGSASGNKDQMNMEDSMAEDSVQSSTPAVPIFHQPSISPPSGFMFGSTASSGPAVPIINQPSISPPSGFKFGSTAPIFNQPSISPPSGFMFGSTASSGVNSFQFGSQQQNPAMPQNPSLFQSSGSLDFNAAGGSFSLGTGGSDKSGRKMIKVSRKPRNGSLDFNAAGGSFSLASGGSDKSGRKMIKVSRKPRKR